MMIMEKLGIAAVAMFCALLAIRAAEPIPWLIVTAPLWVYAIIGCAAVILFKVLRIEHYHE